MTRFVLDKNPEINLDETFSSIMKTFELNTLNSLTYFDPFLKTNFLKNFILTAKTPVIYLDFDLLYTGYITSKVISLPPRVTLYNPTRNEWLKTLKTLLIKISEEKSILIIDSLNTLFNLFNEKKDVGRLVNCYIMLLSYVAKMSQSCVIVASLTKKKDGDSRILSITGRHIIETKKMTHIHLNQSNSNILADVIVEKRTPEKSFKIPIQSELI